MEYQETTMIPNSVLDIHLKTLSGVEVKVLLTVVRQTLGWIDHAGKRKKRDWISHSFFITKTGVSRKSVSVAIQSLIERGIILATDKAGDNTLNRKKIKRIYYALHPSVWGKNNLLEAKKIPSTKLTQDKTKETSSSNKMTDAERFLEILEAQKVKRM